jgi:autotransporter-associated beta strand protein
MPTRLSRCARPRSNTSAPFKLLSSLVVLAGSLSLWGGVASAVTTNSAGPTWAGDDENSATANPYPAIPINNLLGTTISSGLSSFVASNSAAGWSYSWATPADQAKVENGIKIIDYFPWVVVQPTLQAANGTYYPGHYVGETGGAAFNLKYTPVAGAPAIQDLHWIQAFTGSTRGAAVGPVVDNPFNAGSPFYDPLGAAGTLPGGGAWFLDRPQQPEREYESNPVATRVYQVVLAGFNPATKAITLYGGKEWGYTYSAADRTACLWTSFFNSSWTMSSNWSILSVPTSGLVVFSGTNVGRTISLDGSQSADYLQFGDGINASSYTITSGSGGVLTLNGSGSLASITVLSGTHSIAAPLNITANLNIAPATGSLITVSGNIHELSPSLSVSISDGGTAVLTGSNSYSGGTSIGSGLLNINADAALGATSGTLNFGGGGGILQAGANNIVLSASRPVTLSSDNATIDTQGYSMAIAGVISGSGALTQIGTGTLALTASNTYTGATNISGGTLLVNGSLAGSSSVSVATGATLAGSGTVGGSVALDGGVVQLSGGLIVGALNITNGNWRSVGLVGGPVTSTSGLFTIDSGANLVAPSGVAITGGSLAGTGTITGSLNYTSPSPSAFFGTITGSQGVTVNNAAAALTLGGLNNYAGPTNIVAGSLIVNGLHNNGGPYTVASGAILAGSGTIAGTNIVNVNPGGAIAPGSNALAGSAGTLTVPNLILANSSTLLFDLSGNPASGNDQIAVAGGLSIAGTTELSVSLLGSTALGSGAYTLITYNVGPPPINSLVLGYPGAFPARQSYNFDYSQPGKIMLDVSGAPANLTWVGTSSFAWTTIPTLRPWISITSPSGDFFATGDNVTFNNVAVTTVISLSGSLAPGSIFVTGSNNFTFIGSGQIVGTTKLTVNGQGSLTIANSGNNYSGGTAIQSGKVVLGAYDALPAAGTVTFGQGSLSGTLDLAGFNQTVGGLAVGTATVPAMQVITSSSGSSTLTYNGAGSSTFPGLIRDGGGILGLNVVGGSLTLSGSNGYSGGTTVNNGTLVLGSNGALGNGGLTVNNGLVDLNSFNPTISYLSGTGGTITNNGLGIATLTVNLATDTTYGGYLYDSVGTEFAQFALDLENQRKLTLTGNNAYTGLTTISAGTLSINDAGVYLGNFAIGSSAVLNYNGPVTQSLWGVVSGSGSLTKSGSGTLTIFNANTFGGGNATGDIFGTVSIHQGEILVTQGAVLTNNASEIDVGDTAGMTGALTMTSGSAMTPWGSSGNSGVNVGINGGTGIVTLSGTSLLDASCTANSSGGTGGSFSNVVSIGLAGSSGTVTVADNSQLRAVEGTPSSNGSFLSVGAGGSGVLIVQNQGQVQAANFFLGGTYYPTSGGTGTLHLNGGTVSVPQVVNNAGTTGYLYFNGGTLQATASSSNYISAAGTLKLYDENGGAVMDTNGNNITISQPLLHDPSLLSQDGGLTKVGAGTLVLSGVNTYNGGTFVVDGTLIVTNKLVLSDGSNVTVGDSSAFPAPIVSMADLSSADATAVPEPSAVALATFAGLVLLVSRYRRRLLATIVAPSIFALRAQRENE